MELHERSWVEIDLAVFRENLNFLKSFLREDQGFLQVVKADAYGHGAKEIANAALAEGAKYLGVANLDEGSILRRQGIKRPYSFSPLLCLMRRVRSWKTLTPECLICSLLGFWIKKHKGSESRKPFILSWIRACIAVGYASKMRKASSEIAKFKHLEIEEYSAILVQLRMIRL